jgi:hypothetical protein
MAKRGKNQTSAEDQGLLEDLKNIFSHFLEGGHLFPEKQRLTHGINHALLAMFSQATKHPLNTQDFTIEISHPASWTPLKISFVPTGPNSLLSDERISLFFRKLGKALEQSPTPDQVTLVTPAEKLYLDTGYDLVTEDPLAIVCLIETYLASEELMTLDNLKMHLPLSGHDTFDSLADKFRLSAQAQGTLEWLQMNSFIVLPSVPFSSANQAFVTGTFGYNIAANHPEILGFSLENLKAKAVRAVGKQVEACSPFQLH